MGNLIFETLLTLVFMTLTLGPAQALVDQTLTNGTFGKDVVSAVNHKIETAAIFPDDHRLLLRTAWVETRNGETAYRPLGQGGIWKVTSDIFMATQLTNTFPQLEAYHSLIETKFSVNWMTLTRAQLEIPLYSGLAAMLFFQTIPTPVPTTIESQAQYWKLHYNKNESVAIGDYINSVTDLESTFPCRGKMDLVIVLDCSNLTTADLGKPFFESAKSIIIGLLSTFSLDYVNIGFVRYSPLLEVFPLNNNLTFAEITAAIQAQEQGPVDQNTPELGINLAVKMLTGASSREGAPRVIATFTDGAGNATLISAAINTAININIIPYAADISNATNQGNLLIEAGGNPNHLFDLKNLEAKDLDEVAFQLNEQMCKVSQSRDTGIGDELLLNETRYYNFDVTEVGLRLVSYIHSGSLIGYWSDSVPNPSSALHDVSFIMNLTTPVIIPGAPAGQTKKVYVAVQGRAAVSKYALLGVAI